MAIGSLYDDGILSGYDMQPEGYGYQDPMTGANYQQQMQQQQNQMQQAPQGPQAVNPQNMAWGAALQNMGNIIGGRAPSIDINSAYMRGKSYNDNLRNNKAAMERQERQDERQRQQDEVMNRYREGQIAQLEAPSQPKAQKIGKDTYGVWNESTGEFDSINRPEGMDQPAMELSESQNRVESLIRQTRGELEGSASAKQFKAIKGKADTFDKSTAAALANFEKGQAMNTAQQLNLVVSWFKMLDPTSTVSGGEVSSASDPGLANRANSMLNKIKAGGGMTQEQVASFRNSGLAAASSAYDQIASKAQSFMENVVSPNPYFAGREGQIVSPSYSNSPSWFVQGDQRFQGSPLDQVGNAPPPAANANNQSTLDFFMPPGA